MALNRPDMTSLCGEKEVHGEPLAATTNGTPASKGEATIKARASPSAILNRLLIVSDAPTKSDSHSSPRPIAQSIPQHPLPMVVELKIPRGHPNIPPGKQSPLPRVQILERSQAHLPRSCESKQNRERVKERKKREQDEGKENASQQHIRDKQQLEWTDLEGCGSEGGVDDNGDGKSISPENHNQENSGQQLITLPPKDVTKMNSPGEKIKLTAHERVRQWQLENGKHPIGRYRSKAKRA